MKLLNAEEMKNIDNRAMQEHMIPGIILMENAGIRTVELIEDMLENLSNSKVIILVGKGNNGGDGLVIARHLINAGANVDTFLFCSPTKLNNDPLINYNILAGMTDSIYQLYSDEDLDRLMLSFISADLIVDAIYGIGFKGSLGEFEAQVVKMANWSKAPIVSVDIPSGVEADTGRVHGEAIKASHTVTFALPKIGLIMEPGKNYTGNLTVADISIPLSLLNEEALQTNLITQEMVNRFIKPRLAESHKGTYGHALLIGGSRGMTGAIVMSSCAALRSGAGLVTTALPDSLVAIIQSSVMEVMAAPLAETKEGAISIEALPAIENLLGAASVCAIGPGLSRYQEAHVLLRFVLERAGIPIIIDADGLNALEGDISILKDRQIPIIITPHPGEMARLTGKTIEEIQSNRINIARYYASEWGITVVLKGNRTIVASPSGEIYVNITGNPGMATAGSGDVLTGIISGLMAQGLKAIDAAISGVFIHGKAGDKAVETMGENALVAGDIINFLPDIFSELEKIY